MIDLHAHVLPGLDDGPQDMEAAQALLRAAEADGTRVIAATPHLRADFPAVRVEELPAACERVAACLGTGSNLRIVSAAEIDIAWALEATDEQLRLASYGQRGKDLLIETPHGPLPPHFEDMLFRLAVRGFRLLLAHPELSRDFQSQPDRVRAIVERGVLLQVTAASLLSGARRSRHGRLARHLVREHRVHVIASDAHSAGPWRPPTLTAGIAAAAELAPDLPGWLVGPAPAAILAGKPLPPR